MKTNQSNIEFFSLIFALSTFLTISLKWFLVIFCCPLELFYKCYTCFYSSMTCKSRYQTAALRVHYWFHYIVTSPFHVDSNNFLRHRQQIDKISKIILTVFFKSSIIKIYFNYLIFYSTEILTEWYQEDFPVISINCFLFMAFCTTY